MITNKTWQLSVLAREFYTQSRRDAKDNLNGLRYE